MYLAPPERVAAKPWSKVPDRFRRPRRTLWADVNIGGLETGAFLEGPSFDREGYLYVVDIPYGRLFRISPDGAEWTLCYEWDGWPNGSAIDRDGRVLITDYKRGLRVYDPATGTMETLVETYRSESFKGCNDLTISHAGDVYFTDQGQTGWQDPTGRVFRLSVDGRLEPITSHIPSPNSVVLNREETQVWVAVTRANAVWRMILQADGSITKMGTFIQMSGGAAGPDGLAIDDEGGVAIAQPGTTCWRFDQVGRLTHVFDAGFDGFWTNLAYGGEGNRTLFACESHLETIYAGVMPVRGRTLRSHLPVTDV
jgi:gluconolactonase